MSMKIYIRSDADFKNYLKFIQHSHVLKPLGPKLWNSVRCIVDESKIIDKKKNRRIEWIPTTAGQKSYIWHKERCPKSERQVPWKDALGAS